jgi:hypothetical protein
MLKTCLTCKSQKPVDQFYKQAARGLHGVRGTCKECDNKKKKTYRETNKDVVLVMKKANYEVNKGRHLAQKREYRQANKGKINALVALRKKRIKARTPNWLTKFDKLKISCVYSVAAMLTKENKETWHVDHIYPIQGKLVSGLHVPLNLQVMRGFENIKKKNKFEVNHG